MGFEPKKLFISDISEVGIIGKPRFRSKDEIVSNYSNNNLQTFTSTEIQESAGDYFLVDPGIVYDSIRVITSPGFSGWYYVNTDEDIVLSNSLSELGQLTNSTVHEPQVLNYILNGTTKTSISTTIFSEVRRLLPASIYAIDDSKVHLDSYLEDVVDLQSTKSIFSNIDWFEKLSGTPIFLMFSGGIDSTILLLLLSKTSLEITPVTFNRRSRLNGPPVRILEKELEIDVTWLDYSSPFEQEVKNHIISTMKHRLVNPNNPHFGFTDKVGTDGIILSGQNFDAITTINMSNPISTIYLSDLKPHIKTSRFLRNTIDNMRYTDIYLHQRMIREIMGIEDRIRSQYTFDSAFTSTLEGLALSNRPNSLNLNSTNQYIYKNIVREDVSMFNSMCDFEDNSLQLKAFNYYLYARSCQETISGSGTPSSMPVYLPVMWGPILSELFESIPTFKDAFNPKRESYRKFKVLTGEDYFELLSKYKFDKVKDDSPYLFFDYSNHLNKENSMLYPQINHDLIKRELESLYSNLSEESVNCPNKYHRLLNIELLLDSSYKL